jgi:hypothetical protein
MKVISTEAITKLIQIIKDSFIHRGNSEIVNEVTLAEVAISGSYNDLTNKLIAGTNITIQNGIISATSGGSMPIGAIYALNCSPSYVPDGCLPCDGTEYLKAQFYSFWINYIETNYLNTCTYEEYESEIETYGQCAKFAVDTDNFKFKVPTINKVIADVADTLGVRGNGLAIGLTNGTLNGALNTYYNSNSGTVTSAQEQFYGSPLPQNAINTATGKLTGAIGVTTDPINSGIVADVDKTYLELRYFVVVANGQINQSMMDWSAWASSLQGKLNADHSNDTKPYIVETSDESILPSWYRVWSDGWCEQGGLSTTKTATSVINLLKPYKDINSYSVDITWTHTASNDNYGAIVNITSDKSFTVYRSGTGAQKLSNFWFAKGYIN